MKKIVILIMSCRNDFFVNQIKKISETWGKLLPPNMQLAYYDGNWDNNEIVNENGILHIKVSSPDTLEYTYHKTYFAINELINSEQFDYVFRINTSTWVNTRLLRKIVDEIAREDVIYGTDLYSLTEAPCPEPLDLYCRGNAILMSNNICRILLGEGRSLLYFNIVDDVCIGNVINTYYNKLEHSLKGYLLHICGLPHGWYKATESNADNNHSLCRYGECGDQEFYNNFLTVQTKMYRRRAEEDKNMDEFWDMMKDSPEPSLATTKGYIDNPSIFIGSILGYIEYDKWKTIPSNVLYKFEMDHKAIDDRQSKNFSQKAYDQLHSLA